MSKHVARCFVCCAIATRDESRHVSVHVGQPRGPAVRFTACVGCIDHDANMALHDALAESDRTGDDAISIAGVDATRRWILETHGRAMLPGMMQVVVDHPGRFTLRHPQRWGQLTPRR